MLVVADTGPDVGPYVDMLWQTRSAEPGVFTSTASSAWELVVTTQGGRSTITVRGPETRASHADIPADAEFFGITFKLGTFMPHLPLQSLLDRQDLTLPAASPASFWLDGRVWERPTFDNAYVFVARLIRAGLLVRDPIVADVLRGYTPDMSPRSLQYRFVRATGITHKTILQIERAQRAVALLERGLPIAATAFDLGYFDQAHLTKSLRRFIGTTPTQLARTTMVA